MHVDDREIRARARRTLEQRIGPLRYPEQVPLEVSVADVAGEPIPFDEAAALPFRPAEPGERWGTPWSTRWFHVRGRLPDGWAAEEAEVLAELGFHPNRTGFQLEGLAYTVAGVPVKGVHPRSRWVPLAPVLAGRDVELLIEAAANPIVLPVGDDGIPVDFRPTRLGDPRTAGDDPAYRYEGVLLAVRDRTVEGLFHDLEVLLQLEEQLERGSTRSWGLLAAMERALDRLDPADIASTAPAARTVLGEAAASPASPRGHRISAIGHSHIDSAWLWPFRETRRKVARTVANVLHLLDTEPDFVYAMSSAQQLAWLKEDRPALFARIRPYVEAGRFVPVGGMWVEPDTNMPNGESLVRQFVEGGEFFEREFGIGSTDIAWLPDSFGYPGGLPQIVRAAGARRFVTQKISWNRTNRFPHHTFRWEGVDGSVVLTHFPSADTYNSDLSGHDLAHAERNFADKAGSARSLVPFGYGDGGGGPTRAMLERARRLADLEGSPRVRIESPSAFFDALEDEFPEPPVWTGELYLEFHRGVLTSQPAMKQGNRAAEAALHDAELWAATADVYAGFPYPQDELRELWRQVLLLQFHDVLPGSAIAWVHDEARVVFERVVDEAGRIAAAALAALAADGDGETFANPAPFTRDGVPALSTGPRTAAPSPARVETVSDGWLLTNDRLAARVAADGSVVSLIEVEGGRELVAPGGGLGVLQLHPDTPVRWDAWDLDGFYRNTLLEAGPTTCGHAGVDEGGAFVRVERAVGSSHLVQTVRLAPGADALDFTTEVDWQESERILKVAFDLDVAPDSWAAETQFGTIRRPTHANTSWDAAKFEACAHRWIHVGEEGFGIAVANRRTYGHEVRRVPRDDGAPFTVARLSLLRSARFPDPRADAGRHRFDYSVGPAATVRVAAEHGWRLASPLVPTTGSSDALVSAVDPDVVIDTVKLAFDGSGDVVVRLHNAAEGRRMTALRFGFPAAAAQLVDLRERPLDRAPLALDGGLRLRPSQFVTVRVRRTS